MWNCLDSIHFMLNTLGVIDSTIISGNFGPKLNGSVWSNQKSFEKTVPPFEVDHFFRSDQLEFWLNGSHPLGHFRPLSTLLQQNLLIEHCKQNIAVLIRLFFPSVD